MPSVKRQTPRPASRGILPEVLVNIAMSADGKIALPGPSYKPFGSAQDHELLLHLRATAHAVMAGARTVDGFPVNLGPGPARFRRERIRQGLPPYNLRVVVSGNASLNPEAEIFRHRFSPVIVLASAQANPRRLANLKAAGAELLVCGRKGIDFHEALHRLRVDWGVERLLCEGGSTLNDALFRAGLVQRLHVTICPLLLGGAESPTLSDGIGFPNLAGAARFRLLRRRQVGRELFLTYDVVV